MAPAVRELGERDKKQVAKKLAAKRPAERVAVLVACVFDVHRRVGLAVAASVLGVLVYLPILERTATQKLERLVKAARKEVRHCELVALAALRLVFLAVVCQQLLAERVLEVLDLLQVWPVVRPLVWSLVLLALLQGKIPFRLVLLVLRLLKVYKVLTQGKGKTHKGNMV